MKIISIIIFLLATGFPSFSRELTKYVSYTVQKGDRVEKIYKKFLLPLNTENYEYFLKLNTKKTDKNLKLMLNVKYKLPILRLKDSELENFLNIIPNNDSIILMKTLINEYNRDIETKGLKENKREIWIPLYLIKNYPEQIRNVSKTTKSSVENIRKRDKLYSPFYGENGKIKVKSNLLSDYVVYLISGHGGPDPGAIGIYEGRELHEDEYAYDITLRLAKHLKAHGAKVYMITIDTIDGIRDDKFLQPSNKEVFYGGVEIPLNQKERLELTAKILNELYLNETTGKRKHHISINIHLDSRSEEEKIDVFFYYQENNKESKYIAELLRNTFEEQYNKYQPGRGYRGTIETRNLFMLRNSLPTTVYIELGNIRNRNNQIRFIEKINRDALAKWICLGLIKYAKAKNTLKSNKIK
ncbi:MAG: N-acetylmuramoyl-L-alanine amidase [Candidatus Kapaibacteriota bacterium]